MSNPLLLRVFPNKLELGGGACARFSKWCVDLLVSPVFPHAVWGSTGTHGPLPGTGR